MVRLVFLVKGHTKNAADRMFNLLKLENVVTEILKGWQLTHPMDKYGHMSMALKVVMKSIRLKVVKITVGH